MFSRAGNIVAKGSKTLTSMSLPVGVIALGTYSYASVNAGAPLLIAFVTARCLPSLGVSIHLWMSFKMTKQCRKTKHCRIQRCFATHCPTAHQIPYKTGLVDKPQWTWLRHVLLCPIWFLATALNAPHHMLAYCNYSASQLDPKMPRATTNFPILDLEKFQARSNRLGFLLHCRSFCLFEHEKIEWLWPWSANPLLIEVYSRLYTFAQNANKEKKSTEASNLLSCITVGLGCIFHCL